MCRGNCSSLFTGEAIGILGVIIADDEKKICRLIEFLVDWEEMGIQILGVAFDGISAYRMVLEKKPDILLTDIRMPGMDGLELIRKSREENENLKCIIISGFKDFKYAQQGIWYGVRDYLLKPINREELVCSLKKLVVESQEQKSHQDVKVQMEEIIKSYSGELKKVFLKTVLEMDMKKNPEELLMEIRKNNAADTITEGGRCILVKPDISCLGFLEESYQMLLKKTAEIIRSEFAETAGELVMETAEEGIYVLLFQDGMETKKIRNLLNHIRERVIGMRDLFLSIHVTIIFNKEADTPEELTSQIHRSRIASYDRIFMGCNEIVENKTHTRDARPLGILDNSIREVIRSQAETFEMDNIQECLEGAKHLIKHTGGVRGADVRMAMELLTDYFLQRLKKMDDAIDMEEKKRCFFKMYGHCTSVDEAFSQLSKVISETLSDVVKGLKNREIKPVTYAKQYIEDNKGKNIKLEELAKSVGFSYTYFSSLFKKETGQTLSEYIQQVRIEAAKKLLVEKEKSVAQVAELVGYNDMKFFTKQFKKNVGVSPNEYHKMFLER